MAISDLKFTVTQTGEDIYEPERVYATIPKEISLTNLGTEILDNLCIYVIPSSNLGDVDHPADYPPDIDYQDLISWGSDSELGIESLGGLLLTVPQDSGTNTYYVTRSLGSTLDNAIELKSIAANETIVIGLELEVPTSVVARRLYIGIIVDEAI